MHIGLLMFGLGLTEAASHTVHGPKWQQRLSLVGYYLFCDAIERALKSDLKRSGLSKKQLRNISRDLREAVDAELENGNDDGRLAPELKECIGMLRAYYCEKEFEYFSRELGMQLPDTTQLSNVVDYLLSRLDEQYRAD